MSDAKGKLHFLKTLPMLSWLVFAAGLVVQLQAPRLAIENRAFVIPLPADGAGIRPDEIVASERWMQAISAVLTASGALGLAYCYGGALIKRV